MTLTAPAPALLAAAHPTSGSSAGSSPSRSSRVGLALTFGVLGRPAALGGFLLLAPVWLMLLTTDQYFWTYPLDVVPLILLAIVPTGRYLGFDGRLAARFGMRRRLF